MTAAFACSCAMYRAPGRWRSEQMKYGFRWATDRRLAVDNHDGPFDKYRMGRHRSDQCVIAKRRFVQAQFAIVRLVAANQFAWRHAELIEQLRQLCHARWRFQIVDDFACAAAFLQQRQRCA